MATFFKFGSKSKIRVGMLEKVKNEVGSEDADGVADSRWSLEPDQSGAGSYGAGAATGSRVKGSTMALGSSGSPGSALRWDAVSSSAV